MSQLKGALKCEKVKVLGQAGSLSLQLPSGPEGPPGALLLGCLGLQGGVFENWTNSGGFRWSHAFEKRHRFDPVFIILFPKVKNHFVILCKYADGVYSWKTKVKWKQILKGIIPCVTPRMYFEKYFKIIEWVGVGPGWYGSGHVMAVVGADGGRLGVPGAAPLLQRGRTLRLPPQREALGASWSVGPWVPCS